MKHRRGYKEYKLSNFKVRIYDRMSFKEFCKKYKERLMKHNELLKAINGEEFDIVQHMYDYYTSLYPYCNIENEIEGLEQYIDYIRLRLILSDILNNY